MDLVMAARLAEMPIEQFVALNPAFKRPLIRGDTKVVLPTEKVYSFYANLAKYESASLVSWATYHPVRGDTFAKLARRFDLSVRDLKKVNGVAAWSSRLPKTMVVPVRSEAREALKLPLAYGGPTTRVIVHRVKRGDTLTRIARRYRVTVDALKRWNRLRGVLRTGEKIYIHGGRSST
jgi:membrane-bound lytic murein transglycosylase D